MKTLIIIHWFCALAMPSYLLAQNNLCATVKFAAEERWGLIDAKGNTLIAPKYVEPLEFTESLALARITPKGKFGYLDIEGSWAIEPAFDAAEPFSQGFAQVRNGASYGVINKTGAAVLPIIYSDVRALGDGYWGLKRNSVWRIKHATTKDSLESEFSDLKPSGCEHFLVQKNGYWGLVSKSGAEIIPFIYAELSPFYHSRAAALFLSENDPLGRWQVIDPTGKAITPAKYDYIAKYEEGVAAVNVGRFVRDMLEFDTKEDLWDYIEGGAWGLIDQNGKEVLACKYEDVRGFSRASRTVQHGALIVKVDGEYNLINKLGKRLCGQNFAVITPFADNVAWGLRKTSSDKLFTYETIIRPDGSFLQTQTFDYALDFSEDLAAVNIGTIWSETDCPDSDGKWGFINKFAKLVVPLKYDYVLPYANGYSAVYNGSLNCGEPDKGSWGFIDKSGKLIIPMTFADAKGFQRL